MIYGTDALTYIEETPGVLYSILKNRESIADEAMRLFDIRAVEEIYIVGCGSSFHAAKTAKKYIRDLLGVRVFSLLPGDFMDIESFIDKNAIVIGISQQGTSVDVISALDSVKNNGIKTIAMTGEYNTEIIKHADATVYIECGYEDAGATTKGFTATVFTLICLFEVLWEKNNLNNSYREFEDLIKMIIEEMEDQLFAQSEKCEAIAEQLKDCDDLVIIAGDKWKNILGEITLKFSETCRFPVRGYETSEFMHGIYNSVDNNTEFIFLWDNEIQGTEELYNYYEAKGNRIYCFGREKSISVFRDLLPIQKLFVLASKKRGIDLNLPKDPDFHKKMGSKIERMDEN